MGCPRMLEFDFTVIKLRYGNKNIMLTLSIHNLGMKLKNN